jgi:hypothetical protein
VLLRAHLHVWPQLPVSRRLRVREREDEGEPVKTAGASATVVPDASVTASRSLARELLVLLADQRPAFLAFARKRVRSGADAEDLLQQALLKAAERLDTVRDGERLEAWFFRVLRNTIADHHAEARARDTCTCPTRRTRR